MTTSESFLLVPIGAFLVGLILGSAVPFLPLTILSVLFVMAFGMAWCEHHGQVTLGRGILIYGCVLGGLCYEVALDETLARSSILEVAGTQPVTLTGTIVRPVRHLPDGVVMICEVERVERQGRLHSVSGLVRVKWRHPDLTVLQGERIAIVTHVRAPTGTMNPGGFNYEAYLKRRGIQAVASLSGPGQVIVEGSHRSHFWHFPAHEVAHWRQQVRQAALQSLENPALGLYLGMIIGEQSFIPYKVRDAFMATGTVHIISISGSHLGLVAFLSFFLVKAGFRVVPAQWVEQISRVMTPTQVAVAATIPLVLFYTLLAGSEVATVRSLLMILLFFGGLWLGRERQMLLAVGIAALAVAIHDPHALYDVSFQLSYGAALAIALVLRRHPPPPPDEEPGSLWRAMIRRLTSYAWITLAVTVVTLPVVAYAFQQIAWLGLAANSLVVPFVGMLAVPMGLLSAVLVLVRGTDTLPMAWFIQWIFDGLADGVVWMARAPMAVWHVASPSPLSLMMFYAVLLLVVWGWRSHRVKWGGMAVLLVLIGWWAWSPRFVGEPTSLRVTYLDVGQGDATVLELPDGHTILIDGGVAFERWDVGRNIVGPYLWNRGIRRLDHVIATHPQLDHVGGLTWILENFEVGEFWTNGVTREASFYRSLQEVVHRVGLDEYIAGGNQHLLDGSTCRFWSLNPLQPETGLGLDSSSSGTKLNNLSVVTRLDCGPHSFFFPGDVEKTALEQLARDQASQSARVVKIPHHGAKSSFSRSWIEGLQGTIAVVSAGRGNRYGHPAPEVLEAYDRQGMKVYRTDVDGAVWIEGDLLSPHLNIYTARTLMPVPIPLYGSGVWRIVGSERANWIRLWRQLRGIV